MAMNIVDHNILSRLAVEARITHRNYKLARGMDAMLGLCIVLAPQVERARERRKLDHLPLEASQAATQHIVWLSRKALEILQDDIEDWTWQGHYGPDMKVYGKKLRASIFHLFCLFHNTPAILPQRHSPSSATTSPKSGSPLSPKVANGQSRKHRDASGSKRSDGSYSKQTQDISPRSRIRQQQEAAQQQQQQQAAYYKNGSSSKPLPNGSIPIPRTSTRGHVLRDPIPSDTSFVTNPWGSQPPATPPPGFTSTGRPTQPITSPQRFIMPAMDYRKLALDSFKDAFAEACATLPASHPLRLAIGMEYCAFLWDVMGDRKNCRRLAKECLIEVYRSSYNMDDAEFEDASLLVGGISRMARRETRGIGSGTPKLGRESPFDPALMGASGKSGAKFIPGERGVPRLPSTEEMRIQQARVQRDHERKLRKDESVRNPRSGNNGHRHSERKDETTRNPRNGNNGHSHRSSDRKDETTRSPRSGNNGHSHRSSERKESSSNDAHHRNKRSRTPPSQASAPYGSSSPKRTRVAEDSYSRQPPPAPSPSSRIPARKPVPPPKDPVSPMSSSKSRSRDYNGHHSPSSSREKGRANTYTSTSASKTLPPVPAPYYSTSRSSPTYDTYTYAPRSSKREKRTR